MSTYYAWPSNFPDVGSSVEVGRLMKHPLFEKAKKQGDAAAADQLVWDLADRAQMHATAARRPHARLIVVAAADAANQIPAAFARLFARESGLPLDSGALKANSPKHTGKNAIYRFSHRAQFAGKVTTGANYIVIDDVMTQGGTISELRQWIQRQGSRVAEIATLAHTPSMVMSNGRRLAPDRETLKALDVKHGLQAVSTLLKDFSIYGGLAHALTESEARFILKYRSLTELREDLAQATEKEPSKAMSNSAPLPQPRAAGERRAIVA
jgi:orotate phosphoribosyltransferase